MIGSQWLPRALSIRLLVVLSACTSPAPKLYTIAPVDGPVHQSGPPVVLLEQLALERYLERSQIVRSSENYRLNVESNDWWGEPLSAMLSRVLVTELGQRLPRSIVISESGAVSATPDASIALNIRRLDANASGEVVVLAQASVSFKGRGSKPVLRDFRFTVPPSGPTVAEEVAAISVAVGRLADALAALVTEGGR